MLTYSTATRLEEEDGEGISDGEEVFDGDGDGSNVDLSSA